MLFGRDPYCAGHWYNETQYRLTEYLIGVIFGSFFYKYKNRKFNINKYANFLGWTLAIGFLLMHTFRSTNYAWYKVLSREIWACAICWIVFACHCLKSGGAIRSFLSHIYWQPLSKICLSIYIFHYIYATLTPTNLYDFWWKILFHFLDLVPIISLSAVFYLIVEAPTAILTSMFWKYVEM